MPSVVGLTINADKIISKICGTVYQSTKSAVQLFSNTSKRNAVKRAIEQALIALEPGTVKLKSLFCDGLPLPFLAWLSVEYERPDLATLIATSNSAYREAFWTELRKYLGDFSGSGIWNYNLTRSEELSHEELGNVDVWFSNMLSGRMCNCGSEQRDPTVSVENVHEYHSRVAMHMLPASKCLVLINSTKLIQIVQEFERCKHDATPDMEEDFELLAAWLEDDKNYVMIKQGNSAYRFSANRVLSVPIELKDDDYLCAGDGTALEERAIELLPEIGRCVRCELIRLLCYRSKYNLETDIIPMAAILVKMAKISCSGPTRINFSEATKFMLKAIFFAHESLNGFLKSVDEKTIALTRKELILLRGSERDVKFMEQKLNAMNTFAQNIVLDAISAGDDTTWMQSVQTRYEIDEEEVANQVFEIFATSRVPKGTKPKPLKSADGEGYASLLVKAAVMRAKNLGEEIVMTHGLEEIIARSKVLVYESSNSKIMTNPGLSWAFLNVTKTIDFATITQVFSAPLDMQDRSIRLVLSTAFRLIALKERGSDLSKQVSKLVGDNLANIFDLPSLVLKALADHDDIHLVSVSELKACATQEAEGMSDLAIASAVIDVMAACAKRGYNLSGRHRSYSSTYNCLLRSFNARGTGLQFEADEPISGNSICIMGFRGPPRFPASVLTDGSGQALYFHADEAQPGTFNLPHSVSISDAPAIRADTTYTPYGHSITLI